MQCVVDNKGNNKITVHRAIFQREKAKLIRQQIDKISQQPENWENCNGPDLVQAFPKKWWVESDFIIVSPLPVPMFMLVIVLFVLRFVASDCQLGIVKPF